MKTGPKSSRKARTAPGGAPRAPGKDAGRGAVGAPIPDSQRFKPDEVRLGRVNGVFGLRGEVRLFLHNPASTVLDEEVQVTLVAPDGARRQVWILARPGAGRRMLGCIEGVETPEQARALADHELVLPAADLPEPEPGTWYHRDLLGQPVHTRGGQFLGKLHEIQSAGEVDTWVVRGPSGEHWIPALRANIVRVDPDAVVVEDDAALALDAALEASDTPAGDG